MASVPGTLLLLPLLLLLLLSSTAATTGMAGVFQLVPSVCRLWGDPTTAAARSRLECAAACLRRLDCALAEFKAASPAAGCALATATEAAAFWGPGGGDKCVGTVVMAIPSRVGAATGISSNYSFNSSSRADLLPPELRSAAEVLIDFRLGRAAAILGDAGYAVSYFNVSSAADGAHLSGGPASFVMVSHAILSGRLSSGDYSVMLRYKPVSVGVKRDNLLVATQSAAPLDSGGSQLALFSSINRSLAVACEFPPFPDGGNLLAEANSFFDAATASLQFCSVGVSFANSSVTAVLNATASVPAALAAPLTDSCLGDPVQALRIGWGQETQAFAGTLGCFGLFRGALRAADMLTLTGWCSAPLG